MASDRMNQETVTAVWVPPRAAWALGHHFVPLSFFLFFAFSDVSADRHATGTKGSRWRGNSPTFRKGVRSLISPGLMESRLQRTCSTSHKTPPADRGPRHGYEDWTVCRAEDFPCFSSHIYHSVSSGRWNKSSKTEAWECRVQRRNRRETREFHTDPELNAYRALVMGCSFECHGSKK